MTQHCRILATPSAGTTREQMAVVYAIRRARNRHPGCGPSLRELANDLGLSLNDVSQKVSRLLRDGLVTRDDGVPRSLRVVEDA